MTEHEILELLKPNPRSSRSQLMMQEKIGLAQEQLKEQVISLYPDRSIPLLVEVLTSQETRQRNMFDDALVAVENVVNTLAIEDGENKQKILAKLNELLSIAEDTGDKQEILGRLDTLLKKHDTLISVLQKNSDLENEVLQKLSLKLK